MAENYLENSHFFRGFPVIWICQCWIRLLMNIYIVFTLFPFGAENIEMQVNFFFFFWTHVLGPLNPAPSVSQSVSQ